ncbi:23S rRNA (guanosine(2251)-2'-O)-methyltransferase RlmB [Desulfosarcina alkanivorans]|uniref:23S rRNA (Guanosine(2251)-2'-O)-methyltransferase RlmB n=1 Tax=Desulfosarcina alkanivorans TaxID=571177 RepID=A0A5K7YRX3_9BACT|nr:23S rRNA (guanosine(2251)-2'-O)-methyltransferase RlmB [Desulfosarcina alkanivorans]BBO72572.1 23S rRNA (guanosine(2251)-2'-O)-methyltransferase RlmB [Desulfosarcina alkanivorans]
MAAKTQKRRLRSGTREVLYGFHPVMEALGAGRRTIDTVMVDRAGLSDRQARVVDLAQRRRIPCQTLDPEQIRAACGSGQHQGIAARVSPLPVDSLESVLSESGSDTGACLLVLLDSIVDPNNLGAIVRTAHCAGADALVIPKDRAVGAIPSVSKASAGALEHTRLCRVTNLAGTLRMLKKQGVWVAGLAMEGDRTIFQADLKGPLALVVGGEEKGLRPLVRQHCDYLVSIPLCGRVDSLNASAAAAVVLYEAFRQRRASTG